MIEGAAILAVPSVLLALWARWLGRRPAAPRFVRWLPYVFLVVWAAASIITIVVAIWSFGAVSGDDTDPGTKARQLANGISYAFYCTRAEVGALAAGALYLLFGTWRYHWSVRPGEVPGSPPYR
jgi:hypothetical protein